ncbi:EmrB/QacA family drug resistance transporter [Enterobacterales bacterium CwR94]|nr:EmrB/QacA family drug resistance transporter [Enterobacterales bacterium CwR94]
MSTPAAQPRFTLRLALGLLGVLIAALSAGLNDRVTDMALVEIRVGLGIGKDESSWITGVYQAAQVAAMLIAPWFAVTFTLRRVALLVVTLLTLIALLLPWVSSLPLFLGLRVIQGLMAGALPPLLMTGALRFMPPNIKLYGLSAYALTATLGPNLAAPLAAFWTDSVGWAFIFWQIVPGGLLALPLIAWGLPQDPPRLERFQQMDWLGMLTGGSALALLVLTLQQGERLNWLQSPLISGMFLSGMALLIVFVLNEWWHPLPLFKFQMLARPNVAHGLLTLAGILLLALSGSALPSAWSGQVEGFRLAQFAPLALIIAIPQLLLAPLIATLLYAKRVDCRWVLCLGALLLMAACLLGSQLTSGWSRQNFWVIQSLQAVGQPMMVLGVLMSATSVVAPLEGPFAAAMFNSVRGIASVGGAALLETVMSHREKFHSHILLENISNRAVLITADAGQMPDAHAPLYTTGAADSERLAQFAQIVRHQAHILSISDVYLLLAGFAVMLIAFTLLLPQRVWTPHILFTSATPVTRDPR